jgi:hypothetical protein
MHYPAQPKRNTLFQVYREELSPLQRTPEKRYSLVNRTPAKHQDSSESSASLKNNRKSKFFRRLEELSSPNSQCTQQLRESSYKLNLQLNGADLKTPFIGAQRSFQDGVE